jgi:hypothetical protein
MCRQSVHSLLLRKWPLLERGSSDQPKCTYVVSAIMNVEKSGIPSTKAAAQ